MSMLQGLHWIAGLVVFAEALNKLERVAPFAPRMSLHSRLVDGLKALAWLLLGMGGACAFFAPLLPAWVIPGLAESVLHPSAAEVSVMVGFAVLIVRTRVKEG